MVKIKNTASFIKLHKIKNITELCILFVLIYYFCELSEASEYIISQVRNVYYESKQKITYIIMSVKHIQKMKFIVVFTQNEIFLYEKKI